MFSGLATNGAGGCQKHSHGSCIRDHSALSGLLLQCTWTSNVPKHMTMYPSFWAKVPNVAYFAG